MNVRQEAFGAETRRSAVSAATAAWKTMQAPQSRCDDALSATRVPSWKRVLDITGIILVLPGVLLLLLFIAAAIKVLSPGPVFFKQERIGHRRQRFLCWKFRTMKVGSETVGHQRHLQQLLQSDAPMTKLDAAGDPRLMPFGAILRATGLDELPQLINVWRGEMSVVGPRPCLPYELERYLPWHHARFDTLPGLTGLWQVSGKNKTTFTEMVTLDICYARNKSPWLDLKIMAKTFSTLASQVRDVRGKAPPKARTMLKPSTHSGPDGAARRRTLDYQKVEYGVNTPLCPQSVPATFIPIASKSEADKVNELEERK